MMMTTILRRFCRWIITTGGGVLREELGAHRPRPQPRPRPSHNAAAAWDDGDPDAVRIMAGVGPPLVRWDDMTDDERARATLAKIVW
jgi:hypothetical protein